MATKAKATKAVATKATKKAKTPKVTPTEDAVLDARKDITDVPEGMAVCGVCKTAKEQTTENFSPKQNGGGFHSVCKPCRTKASADWTTKRANYRKQYQRAVQLLNRGIPVLTPNAKDWKEGDVLMTIEYTDKATGKVVPSRPAEDVYAEMRAAEAEVRAELKAQREAQKAQAKAQREAERAKAKTQREAEQAQAKAQREAERAKAKAQRALERAKKAEADRKEKEAKALARAAERAQKAVERAEQLKAEREAKNLAKAEAIRQKALDKATEVAEQADARLQASIKTAKAVASTN